MDFAQFKQKILHTFRIDLNSYKETQLRRRLDSFLIRQKITGYQELFDILQKERRVYEDFLDCVTINVSEFFRDPARFSELEQEILPELLERKRSLRIWSAACANGAEPYSVAIILDELTPHRFHRLEATDIDKKILVQAVTGRYTADVIRNVSAQRLARYFIRQGNWYVIKEEIKKRVSFRQHDLLTDSFGQGYDMIICRNVTIYFTREAQERLNWKFAQALAPGGVLFVGGSEMIFNYQKLGLEKVRTCFYRRTGGGN